VKRGTSWLAILMVGAAGLAVWIFFKKTAPPEIEFTKVQRETMISSLNTNGKVDPVEWMPVRAERAGLITRVLVARGQQVKAGTPMVELDTRVATAELSRAQAGIREAQTQEKVLDQGGRAAERQQLESDLSRARLDLDAAEKQYQALDRLVAKQAATRVELDTARQTVDQLRLRIQALEQHKASLVTAPDKEIARARIQQAESTAAIARTTLAYSIVHAPMDGAVYDFDLRQGSFLNPGDLIAKVGKLERVRVTVYVDEPDLGKVRKGETVTITWQALPGHQWKGEVDKLPSQVVPLGTRQVGEVGAIIENPERDLLPNANIDADIQATVMPGALSLQKEAIRRQGTETGVFLLQTDRVVWRPIKLGISSYTKSQILSGLQEGDAVALPTEKPLNGGSKVQPVFP
jgi:HlyD family secretion protein